jgi:Flp pilus assembly protein TadD
MEHVQAAIAIAPDYARARSLMARTLDRLGKTSEAEREFQTLLRLDPTKESYQNYATFLALHGQLERALQLAEEGQRRPGPRLASLDALIANVRQDLVSAKQ